jgi:hypothetical protein
MIDAKTHASRNTLYFQEIIEISRRLIWYIMKPGLTPKERNKCKYDYITISVLTLKIM